MAFWFRGRSIAKVGVIGSGQIGPDIALHFAKTLYAHDAKIVVVDVSEDALAKGKAKLTKKIDKGAETKAFKPAQADAMKACVLFTSDYGQLAGADFIVEAATEDLPLKRRIFKQVEALVSPEAILGSNSSHIEPERIFAEVEHKGRALCTHYFFPAERNPAMEIIPTDDTDPAITDFIMRFYEFVGKIPVKVGSRYGYSVDPVFEGLMLACIQCLDGGLGNSKQVDTVGAKCLGLAVGPLTAQNLTGGNPISAHGMSEMHERLVPWYRSPKRLDEMVAAKADWEVPGRGEKVELSPELEQQITDELLGAYFAMCCEILDSGIITVSDYDLLMGISLNIKPPFATMNKMGVDKALALVEAFSKKYPDMPVSKRLKAQAATGKPWEILDVLFEKKDDVGIITIRRPQALNALNSKVIGEIVKWAEVVENDPDIKAAVLTGFGNKAFVAGADIKEMAGFTTPEQGEQFARMGQIASMTVQKMTKPLVAAMGGFALGGGLEIAMCCTARVAAKGIGFFCGQPEINLGLIPGMGGTQRLPRIIGFEKASEMIRTANPISSDKAHEYGLVNDLADGDVLDRAIEFARGIANGTVKVKPMELGPLPDAPSNLPDVDIGYHSKVIDKLCVDAILEGARMTLEDGLKNEAKRFGQCWTTEDTRIGLSTFVQKGAKAKAEFVHK